MAGREEKEAGREQRRARQKGSNKPTRDPHSAQHQTGKSQQPFSAQHRGVPLLVQTL